MSACVNPPINNSVNYQLKVGYQVPLFRCISCSCRWMRRAARCWPPCSGTDWLVVCGPRRLPSNRRAAPQKVQRSEAIAMNGYSEMETRTHRRRQTSFEVTHKIGAKDAGQERFKCKIHSWQVKNKWRIQMSCYMLIWLPIDPNGPPEALWSSLMQCPWWSITWWTVMSTVPPPQSTIMYFFPASSSTKKRTITFVSFCLRKIWRLLGFGEKKGNPLATQ